MNADDQTALTRILTTAISYRASDLHLIVGTQPTVRLDGQLTALEKEPVITAAMMETAAEFFLTAEQRQQLITEKELVAAVSPTPDLRCKLMAFYQRGSLSLTVHFISTAIKKLSELGLPDPVTSLIKLSKGLILITGPYGSGRTTTLNALINEINNTRSANIVTIEQPIEYLFTNSKSIIEQRAIGQDAVSYEQAIKSASREDVDVIVVAEAETPAVIKGMLEAAEASRLVLSTMSTDSVLATVDTILNSVPAAEMSKIRLQLSTVLVAIISQRLITRANGGLVMVPDIMIPNGPIRSIMRDGALAQLTNAIQTARAPGVVAFDRALIQLVEDGTITMENALANAQDQAVVHNAHRQ